MSLEEDIEVPETELKELVTQALEENGLLSKIRAQLRAGLYVALENEINETNKHCHISSSLKNSLANADVRTIFCLVIEFLEYFNLDFTKSVFEKESFMGILYDYKGKEKLIKELEIDHNETKIPLLVEILNIARNSYKYNTKIINNVSLQNVSSFINDTRDINNATYDVPNTEDKVQTDELDSPRNILKSANESIETSLSSVESDVSKGNARQTSHNGDKILSIHKLSNVQNMKTEEDVNKLETDDTYEGTSSLADDSVASNSKPLIDLDKTAKIQSNTNSIVTVKCLMDQTINESSLNKQNESSDNSEMKKDKIFKSLLDQTIVDDTSLSKTTISDKKKTKIQTSGSNTPSTPTSGEESPLNKTPRLMSDSEKKKHDKKPMSGLSSLADLPPLQVTKARSPDTVLLPSLYSKEFREKSSLKEIDKLLDLNFDSIDNYEEDDILSASIDYDKHQNVNSVVGKAERFEATKNFGQVKLFDNDNKNVRKDVDKSEKSVGERQSSSDVNSNVHETNKDADTTSISEDFDFNSNSDDILKSDKTHF